MPTISSIPTFAILGETNDGKTTVVATLAEVDTAEIHPDPDTTKVCGDFPVVFDEQEVIRFVDTPGFGHPLEALEWFKVNEHVGGSLAEKFRAEHADSTRFALERELLKPLAAGAAVIYVVDGSQPVRQTDRAQMELITLATPSDRPRVAVINSKRDSDTHVKEWHAALSKEFHIRRVFNAHSATFSDRLNLLSDIRGIIEGWKPVLDETIAAYQDDWEKRIEKSADGICELLKSALSCSVTEELPSGENGPEASRRVEQRLKDAIRDKEDRYRKKVRGYFRHQRSSGPAHDSVLVGDLFSEEVMRVFGLSKHALAIAIASISATLAAIGDALFHGASMGMFAVGGFVLGYAAGYWGANKLVSTEVPGILRSFLPRAMKEHGRSVTARPSPLSNLPWLLLNRSIEYFHWASTWSHGRTDKPVGGKPEGSCPPWHSNNWDKEKKGAAEDFIALAAISRLLSVRDRLKKTFRSKTKDPETIEKEMRKMLVALFEEMTGFKR